ncbi:MAG: hypothetical protein J3K34DRAFT_522889 [Monoraphidium minutum]|nr:MAG: hypothetical protein J3K34DRAFT_522889 [Monoraphidium minutum]
MREAVLLRVLQQTGGSGCGGGTAAATRVAAAAASAAAPGLGRAGVPSPGGSSGSPGGRGRAGALGGGSDPWDEPGEAGSGGNGGRGGRGAAAAPREAAEPAAREPGAPPPPPRGIHPIALSELLRSAEHPRDLSELARDHGASMNARHIVTALSRAAKLARATPGVAPATAYAGGGGRRGDAGSGGGSGGWGAAAPDLAAQQLRALARALAAPLRAALGGCGPRELSLAVWAYARLGVRPPGDLLPAIADELLSWGKLWDCSPQQLAGVAWGMARLGGGGGCGTGGGGGGGAGAGAPLWGPLAAAAAARLGEARGEDLSMLAWALAKAGHRDDALMGGIAARVVAALGGGGGGSSGGLMPAGEEEGAGRRQEPEQREREGGGGDEGGEERGGRGPGPERRARLPRRAVAGDAAGGGPVFTPQALANIAWAHAALGVRDEALFGAVMRVVGAPPLLYEARAQELSSLLWAAVTLGVPLAPAPAAAGGGGIAGDAGAASDEAAGESMAERLAAAALRRPGECGAAELSNLMWALASLRQQDQARAAGDVAPPLRLWPGGAALPGGDETEAARSAAAAGSAGHTFAALSRALQQRLGAANGADVSQALWAAAALRHFDAALLQALATASAALAQTGLLAPAEAATCAWALARLGFRDEGALRALGDAAAAMAAGGRLKGVDVASLAWSFAVLEVPHPELTAQLGAYLQHNAPRMDDHALTLAAYGLARAGAADPAALAAAAAACAARADTMGARDLLCAARALGEAPHGMVPAADVAAFLEAAAGRCVRAAEHRDATSSPPGGGGGSGVREVLSPLLAALSRAARRHDLGPQLREPLAAARGAAEALAALLPSHGGSEDVPNKDHARAT